jgi:BirA family biotin operon repressor/biotin-[acetyl-CoA-carboxylase] ligase
VSGSWTTPLAPIADGLVVRLEEVGSTQDEARRLAVAGTRHGTCVVARRQTAGRGRLGRSWLCVEGSLACSFVLRFHIGQEPIPGGSIHDQASASRGLAPDAKARAPRLTLLAALALAEAVTELGARGAGVKWPNDLVIPWPTPGPLGPLRKVAGILVEGLFDGRDLVGAILGVGVNVRRGALPETVSDIAACLEDAGATPHPDAVLAALRPRLDAWLPAAFADAAFTRALTSLRATSVTLGRRVRVEGIEGEAVDLDADGALLVRDGTGVVHVVRAGDVCLASSGDPER